MGSNWCTSVSAALSKTDQVTPLHKTKASKKRSHFLNSPYLILISCKNTKQHTEDEAMAFAFPNSHHAAGNPAFLEIMDTCLSMGSGELIPCFVLFVSTTFALLSKLYISTQERFLHFYPPDSLLHSTGASEQTAMWM